MNEANEFYENMRSRHQAVLSWRDGSGGEAGNAGKVNQNGGNTDTATELTSESGNGETGEDDMSILEKDGIPSPLPKVVDLTPNG
jgi:autophagy-related protein 16